MKRHTLYWIAGSIIAALVILTIAIAGVLYYPSVKPAIGPLPDTSAPDIIREQPSLDQLLIGDTLEPSDISPLSLAVDFRVGVYADNLAAPRGIVLDPSGVPITSVFDDGTVVALPDDNGDGEADRRVVLTDGLDRPHGLLVDCSPDCTLYVAAHDALYAYSYDADRFQARDQRVLATFPTGGNHVTRSLAWSDDTHSRLLVSIGSSCNVCNEEDSRRASVIAMDPDGSNVETYASGLRNAVFMATHPGTGDVWTTEMGRDLLGDDTPPDEINVLQEGADYGWPYCYGDNVHDDDFDKAGSQVCAPPDRLSAKVNLQAHSAPIGLGFVPPTEAWPAKYHYNLFVAYHGSWNRSEPTGYKVVRIPIDAEGNVQGEPIDFFSGFLLDDGSSIGRPAGLQVTPDGSLFVTDDKAGAIYRISLAPQLFDAPLTTGRGLDGCVVTGCSGQICSDHDVVSTCEFQESYACYKDAICERQATGQCGWTQTPALKQCLRPSS